MQDSSRPHQLSSTGTKAPKGDYLVAFPSKHTDTMPMEKSKLNVISTTAAILLGLCGASGAYAEAVVEKGKSSSVLGANDVS